MTFLGGVLVIGAVTFPVTNLVSILLSWPWPTAGAVSWDPLHHTAARLLIAGKELCTSVYHLGLLRPLSRIFGALGRAQKRH